MRCSTISISIALVGCILKVGPATGGGGEGTQMAPEAHFIVVSNTESPSSREIEGRLEATWERFRDLFGIEPEPVRVVVSPTSGGAQATSRADQGNRGDARTIAWRISEGEDLDSQGSSDLSHEIAHIYLMDLMATPPGHHQPHAWLHEAVACYHEGEAFLDQRRRWIRDRMDEHIPLGQLFEMQNPVKQSPLVELTVELHEKLARGEITVIELNERVSSYATAHAEELAQAGVRNMTYYAQSLSVLEFLLEREGRGFVRSLVRRLADGSTMEGVLRALSSQRGEIPLLETDWVAWVRAEKAPGKELGDGEPGAG